MIDCGRDSLFVTPRSVPIDLTEFERGAPFTGDVAGALAALQHRVGAPSWRRSSTSKRALIVFEGPEGAGKRELLKLLGAALDPTYFCGDHNIARPPPARSKAIGWRGSGRACPRPATRDLLPQLVSPGARGPGARAWSATRNGSARSTRSTSSKSQQRDYGTLIVKLFFHVTDATQQRRLEAREDDAWQRHLLGPEELRTGEARAAYRQALIQMLGQTDTRWAPWVVIDANDGAAAQVAALDRDRRDAGKVAAPRGARKR